MSANADNLTAAITAWVTNIAGKVGNDSDRGAALSVGSLMPGAELSVTANLRAGVLVLSPPLAPSSYLFRFQISESIFHFPPTFSQMTTYLPTISCGLSPLVLKYA